MVLFTVSCGAENAFYDGGTDFVFDGALLIACGSDEELVFDIDEVLAVADDVDVGIGNGVLEFYQNCLLQEVEK